MRRVLISKNKLKFVEGTIVCQCSNKQANLFMDSQSAIIGYSSKYTLRMQLMSKMISRKGFLIEI